MPIYLATMPSIPAFNANTRVVLPAHLLWLSYFPFLSMSGSPVTCSSALSIESLQNLHSQVSVPCPRTPALVFTSPCSNLCHRSLTHVRHFIEPGGTHYATTSSRILPSVLCYSGVTSSRTFVRGGVVLPVTGVHESTCPSIKAPFNNTPVINTLASSPDQPCLHKGSCTV